MARKACGYANFVASFRNERQEIGRELNQKSEWGMQKWGGNGERWTSNFQRWTFNVGCSMFGYYVRHPRERGDPVHGFL